MTTATVYTQPTGGVVRVVFTDPDTDHRLTLYPDGHALPSHPTGKMPTIESLRPLADVAAQAWKVIGDGTDRPVADLDWDKEVGR